MLFVASLLTAQWGSEAFPRANFFLLPARGWELLAGALLAKLELDHGRNVPGALFGAVLPAAGLLLIVGAVFLFDHDTPHPSLITVLPVAGTMALIWFARAGEPVTAFLSNRLVVGVGLISYSLYLWHFPVFALTRIAAGTPSNAGRMALIALCVFLAVATYVLIESPLRARPDAENPGAKRHPLYALPTRTFVGLMAGLFVAVGVVGAAGVFTNGFERLYRARHPFYAAYQDVLKYQSTDLHDNGDCHFHAMTLDAAATARIDACFRKYGPGIVVLGDSHGMDLYNALSFKTEAPFLLGISQGGCRPHDPLPKCHYGPFLDYLSTNPGKIKKVVFVMAGRYLLVGPNGEPVTRLMFEEEPRAPENRPDGDRLQATAAYLKLSPYADVAWLGPRVEPHVPLASIFEAGCDARFTLKPGTVETFERLDQFLRDFLAGVPEVAFESQIKRLRFDVESDLFSCDTIYWRDGEHFSRTGEERFGARLKDLVDE